MAALSSTVPDPVRRMSTVITQNLFAPMLADTAHVCVDDSASQDPVAPDDGVRIVDRTASDASGEPAIMPKFSLWRKYLAESVRNSGLSP